MAKSAARFWPESAKKASTVQRHMLAEAHLQRDQKHSLPRQNLQQAVECDMKDGLHFSASRASMQRNAQNHTDEGPELRAPNLCNGALHKALQ